MGQEIKGSGPTVATFFVVSLTDRAISSSFSSCGFLSSALFFSSLARLTGARFFCSIERGPSLWLVD